MTLQNIHRHVTAKPFDPPTGRDFWGKSWFKIFEGNKYITSLKAKSEADALRIYSQRKYELK